MTRTWLQIYNLRWNW